MPLKISENDNVVQSGNQRPEPILHKPKKSLSVGPKVILWIVLVIVLVVGGTWLFRAGFLGKKSSPPRETEIARRIDSVKPSGAAESGHVEQPGGQPKNETVGETSAGEEVTATKALPSPVKPPEKQVTLEKKTPVKPGKQSGVKQAETKAVSRMAGTGQFTIYIGLYKSKAVAEEEVTRWREAGFESFVADRSGTGGTMYAVCLGRFTSREEARNQAEKLKDGFEGGYLVDVVK